MRGFKIFYSFCCYTDHSEFLYLSSVEYWTGIGIESGANHPTFTSGPFSLPLIWIGFRDFWFVLGENCLLRSEMNSSESSFQRLYLKRLLRAFDRLKRPSSDLKGSSNIRLAADVSLALAASPRALWRHGLMNKISCDESNRRILRRILGRKRFGGIMAERARTQSYSLLQSRLKDAVRNKKSCSDGWKKLYVMRRRFLLCRSPANRFEPLPASLVARRLVNRRTKQLQRLIPGGKSMDTSCLLRETADYIVALKTQVEVLQSLVNDSHVHSQQHPVWIFVVCVYKIWFPSNYAPWSSREIYWILFEKECIQTAILYCPRLQQLAGHPFKKTCLWRFD